MQRDIVAGVGEGQRDGAPDAHAGTGDESDGHHRPPQSEQEDEEAGGDAATNGDEGTSDDGTSDEGTSDDGTSDDGTSDAKRVCSRAERALAARHTARCRRPGCMLVVNERPPLGPCAGARSPQGPGVLRGTGPAVPLGRAEGEDSHAARRADEPAEDENLDTGEAAGSVAPAARY
ncbi:MAG: hypothetical protein FJ137_00485 [Deltaproteobacteria bacterium]|nr:hypothetical protein [Deltaproteobacteria bacterium]